MQSPFSLYFLHFFTFYLFFTLLCLCSFCAFFTLVPGGIHLIYFTFLIHFPLSFFLLSPLYCKYFTAASPSLSLPPFPSLLSLTCLYLIYLIFSIHFLFFLLSPLYCKHFAVSSPFLSILCFLTSSLLPVYMHPIHFIFPTNFPLFFHFSPLCCKHSATYSLSLLSSVSLPPVRSRESQHNQ